MIKRLLTLGLLFAALAARAQATLGTSPYTESFDNLANGLPTGFSVYTAATATSLGSAPTPAQLILTPGPTTTWAAAGAGFKNYASATGLPNTASPATQTAAPNRALGVRQTGAFADGANVGPAFVFRLANTTGKTDFALSFKLQSLDSTIMTSSATGRTAVWRVDYGLGATPTAFTQVGSTATTGPVFSNTTITASFGGALDNLAGPVWIRIVSLTGTTGGGSRPSSAIDDFSLSWNANASAPALTVAPSALNFGKQTINQPSAAQTYTLTGANLTGPVAVRASGSFTVSKDGTTFGDSLSYALAELAQPRQVYVRFTPTTLGQASGPVSGTVTNRSAGATSRTVALTGTGNDPTQTVYDFNACTGGTTLADGWIQYSVTGAQTWACTTFGRDPSNPAASAAYPNAVQMNGYAGGANVANEDWLISPALTLASTTYPLLSYWTRTAFNGPALRLRVSTNYSGTGSPNASGVTWTDLNASFPGQGSDVWQTSSLDLSAYKTGTVYVAFVYSSTTNAAARWTVDDVVLTNSATPAPPAVRLSLQSLNFGYQAVNTAAYRTITLTTSNLTDPLTVTSPNTAFQLSKDSLTYSPTLTFSQAEASNRQLPIKVRFLPTQAGTSYTAVASATTADVSALTLPLSGDTYDPAQTLEVVNWNVEWFGSVVAGHGPADKGLQQTNISAVLNTLNADVYALAEVVDTVRLASVVTQLTTGTGHPYAWKVSPYGSYGDNPRDPDYVDDQKLAFVYRTDVVSNPTFLGLLRCSEAQNCPAYNAWAGGRFPYLMSGDVTLNGLTRRVNFIVIHAKANATTTSLTDYARRQTGADLLKSLLDTSYPNQNTLIVGDYNDVLNGTIAAVPTGSPAGTTAPTVSSYNSFLLDTNNYVPLTLPLATAGAQSTVSYNTVIDNVIASKPMANYYLSGTAAIRTDVAAGIANYGTTTSDHYPVLTRYSFSQVLATRGAATAALGLYPNPVTNGVRLEVPETGNALSLSVYTTTGRLVLSSTGSVEQLNQQLGQRVAGLASGLYVVRVVGARQTYVSRFQKL